MRGRGRRGGIGVAEAGRRRWINRGKDAGDVRDWLWGQRIETEATDAPARKRVQRIVAEERAERGIDGVAGDEIDLGLFEHRAKLALGGEQAGPPGEADDVDHVRQAICGCHSRLRHGSPTPFIAGFCPHALPVPHALTELPRACAFKRVRGSRSYPIVSYRIPSYPVVSCLSPASWQQGSACQSLHYNTNTT